MLFLKKNWRKRWQKCIKIYVETIDIKFAKSKFFTNLFLQSWITQSLDFLINVSEEIEENKKERILGLAKKTEQEIRYAILLVFNYFFISFMLNKQYQQYLKEIYIEPLLFVENIIDGLQLNGEEKEMYQFYVNSIVDNSDVFSKQHARKILETLGVNEKELDTEQMMKVEILRNTFFNERLLPTFGTLHGVQIERKNKLKRNKS